MTAADRPSAVGVGFRAAAASSAELARSAPVTQGRERPEGSTSR
ncbi:hypothetical protein [Kineosporia rhizophila]|nr:hypothetical protein [Kineosporia rhizophila]